MENAELYKKSNNIQYDCSMKFLDKYFDRIKWKSDDVVMDVGCGPGDFMYTLLKSMVPENIKIMIGVDINENMIKTAADDYKDPKLEFDILDITGDIPEKFLGKIDHIVSFFCLHWCKDQPKTMKNLSSLLAPGGDCLFVMVANFEQLDSTYDELALNPRWKKYMYDIEKMYLPYRFDPTPEDTLKKYLTTAGFDVVICEHQEAQYDVNVTKNFKAFESIDPFIPRIPPEEQSEYMTEFKRLYLSKSNNLTLNLLHVYAVKNML